MSADPKPGDLLMSLPRTAVPTRLDPVAQARAELKAALFAIEDKANVPRRLQSATTKAVTRARIFSRRHPAAAAAAVLGTAAVVGLTVWAIVNSYTRSGR